MSAQEHTEPSSSFDMIKWILSFGFMAAAVYANHSLVDGSILIRVGSIIGLVVVGLGLGFTTIKGKAGLAFAKESRIEARKVVWPTRSETIQTTIIIVIAVTLISLLLWGIDAVLVNLINFLTVKG